MVSINVSIRYESSVTVCIFSSPSDRKTRSRNKQKKYKDGEGSDADDGDDDAESKAREVRGHDATDMNKEKGGGDGDAEKGEKPKKEKHTSARKFFGENEDVYIMDAKQVGNIGRYMNHSCRPNMFVQNCFVDTHDLRSVEDLTTYPKPI